MAVSTVTDVDADGSVVASRNGDVLRLTLDRSARRNALSHAMIDELVVLLTDATTDDSLLAIHIHGAGTDFCAGADWVASNSADRRPRPGDLVRRIPQTTNRVVEVVHGIQSPVVCSVQGRAVGLGCNLALAADFTIAVQDAVFWEPFVGRGFAPDSGSTWLLPRLIGLARAREMLLLGEKVSGSDAADWGLIHRCVSATELDGATDRLLTRLASGPRWPSGWRSRPSTTLTGPRWARL
ncbi:MAG: enoyl-CoA hydratase-related protein [Mycobacterium sp.]